MKTKRIIIMLIITCICCSCSIHIPYPTEGIWYCERLKMSIDFAKSANELGGAEVEMMDGSIHYFLKQIDFGGNIFITIPEPREVYLKGRYQWIGDTFVIKTETDIYVFKERIQE